MRRNSGDYFELLCGIYVPGAGGKVLVDWLMDDWQLFPIHRDTANALLVEILDDGERVRQPLIPSDRCDSDRLNRWEELRDELRHKNRFFPETDFEHERLEVLLQHLMRKIDDDVTTWYRARIQKGQIAFPPEQMERLQSRSRRMVELILREFRICIWGPSLTLRLPKSVRTRANLFVLLNSRFRPKLKSSIFAILANSRRLFSLKTKTRLRRCEETLSSSNDLGKS